MVVVAVVVVVVVVVVVLVVVVFINCSGSSSIGNTATYQLFGIEGSGRIRSTYIGDFRTNRVDCNCVH